LSFPSGHSSISFAGNALLALFLRHALGVPQGVFHTLSAVAAGAPLGLATWVACTRIRDRFHNVVDVVCGSLLGIACAQLAWSHFLATRRHELLAPLVRVSACGNAGAGVDEEDELQEAERAGTPVSESSSGGGRNPAGAGRSSPQRRASAGAGTDAGAAAEAYTGAGAPLQWSSPEKGAQRV